MNESCLYNELDIVLLNVVSKFRTSQQSDYSKFGRTYAVHRYRDGLEHS